MFVPVDERMAGLKFGRAIMDIMTDVGKKAAFDRVLSGMKVLECGNGRCVATLELREEHVNRAGKLHGGCAASMIDLVSTVGVMTTANQVPGATIVLGANFLRTVDLGTVVRIESVPLKVGQNVAHLNVCIKNEDGTELYVVGQHCKYVGMK